MSRAKRKRRYEPRISESYITFAAISTLKISGDSDTDAASGMFGFSREVIYYDSFYQFFSN